MGSDFPWNSVHLFGDFSSGDNSDLRPGNLNRNRNNNRNSNRNRLTCDHSDLRPDN